MRYDNGFFNQYDLDQRLGNELTMKDELKPLERVETHLLKLMEKYPTDVCHDRGALEPPYFNTINYTMYAGGVCISPLQPDLAKQQILDAILDNESDGIDYNKYMANKVEIGCSKYSENTIKSDYECEALVVLPGNNKIFTNICYNKLNLIIREHGKLAVFKPHPLTSESVFEEFKSRFPKIMTITDPLDDVYHYMKKAKKVYTSHLSETAMYAKAMGLDISPIDTFQTRITASFGHINDQLFMGDADIKTIISSYKSGLIFPDIQEDWKERVHLYLEYIHKKRMKVKDYYV